MIEDEIRTKRLVLVDGKNMTRLVLEISKDGIPTLNIKKCRLIIGDPDRGSAVEIDERGILLWGHQGNVVLAIRSGEEGGVIHFCDRDGREKKQLP